MYRTGGEIAMDVAHTRGKPLQRDHTIIYTGHEFAQLRAEWTQLLAESGLASPFLSWEWMYTWWQVYGEPDPGYRLQIVTARENGRLVAILPAYTTHRSLSGKRACILFFLGSEKESSDYLDIIQRDPDDRAIPAEIFRFLTMHTAFPPDLIICSNLLDDSPLLKTLSLVATAMRGKFYTQHHRICPYVPILGDWESYLQGLSKNMRQQVLRRRKKMGQMAGIECKLVESPDALEQAIHTLFELHEQRFASKQQSSKFTRANRQVFHDHLSKLFLERGILKLFELRQYNQVIASLYCFEFAGELFYFQAGMDPQWEQHSAGTVLMSKAIEYAHDRQLKRFDFMRGSESYKFRWTGSTRNIVLAYIGLTATGKYIVTARQAKDRIRQVLRQIVPQSSAPPDVSEDSGKFFLKRSK